MIAAARLRDAIAGEECPVLRTTIAVPQAVLRADQFDKALFIGLLDIKCPRTNPQRRNDGPVDKGAPRGGDVLAFTGNHRLQRGRPLASEVIDPQENEEALWNGNINKFKPPVCG